MKMIFLFSENVFITASLMETKTYLNIYFDSFSEYLVMYKAQSTERHKFRVWEIL